MVKIDEEIVLEKVCDAKHEAITENIAEIKADIKTMSKQISSMVRWLAGTAITTLIAFLGIAIACML